MGPPPGGFPGGKDFSFSFFYFPVVLEFEIKQSQIEGVFEFFRSIVFLSL